MWKLLKISYIVFDIHCLCNATFFPKTNIPFLTLYTTRSTLVTWWVMKNEKKDPRIKIHTFVSKETILTNKQVHRFKNSLRFNNSLLFWETMFWLSCIFDYSSVWSCYHMQWSWWMSRGWFLQMLWWILWRFLFKYIYII